MYLTRNSLEIRWKFPNRKYYKCKQFQRGGKGKRNRVAELNVTEQNIWNLAFPKNAKLKFRNNVTSN